MDSEKEQTSKKKLTESFGPHDLQLDGCIEIAPGVYRVNGDVEEWARAHGCTPINEVLQRLDEKYFGGNEQD